jgi:formylglycine-generating enzyme required for sulfatase activity
LRSARGFDVDFGGSGSALSAVMSRAGIVASAALGGTILLTGHAHTAAIKCAADAVLVGTLCVDRYEASVWQISNRSLVKKVQAGKATVDDLTVGGATQVSPASPTQVCGGPPFPATFPPTGHWTEPLYAASLPGVLPTGCVTWFQAEQACALAGKRLLTSQEWQRAAAGTTDVLPADENSTLCNTFASNGPVPTGSRTECVSRWGALDMVGNLYEWVADWADRSSVCNNWPPEFGGDAACFGGPGAGLPGAVFRGGYWGLTGGSNAGPFAITNINAPSFGVEGIGFRCAR